MLLTRRVVLFLGALISVDLSLREAAKAQAKLALNGEVRDKEDRAIGSVLVRAYRGSSKMGEATTGADGRYSLSFDRGAPIDTVRYERSGYNPGVVDDLCGTRDQNVSKTLYPSGSRLSLFEGQEALSALERIFFIESTGKTMKFPELQDRYGSIAKNLQIPSELNDRRQSVAKLYGIG